MSEDTDRSHAGGEDDLDKQSKKKDLTGKKKDLKKGQKEQGYVKFDEEDSDNSMAPNEDIKSPSKAKKSKAFRFAGKKFKEKDEKRDKDSKKEEKDKEKKKEEKEGKKHKIKGKKKSKHAHPTETNEDSQIKEEAEKPIFGVPLATAVERSKSHDGIELPRLVRECIDYIEEHGLSCEGIYRISGVKSKIQMLKDCYNRGMPVYLEEHEPNIIASLLKQFLRELPEPVLTKWLMPKFEEASVIRGEKLRVEAFRKLIKDLPPCNRLLLSWMIVHMTHIIEREKENKMSLQNVSIVLSPTMQISHRVLNILFSSSSKLFQDIELKRYKPPIKPATSRWSLELPDNPSQMEEELQKQESLLNALHSELNTGVKDEEKEEQLWEVQRIITQLKRKIKLAKKAMETAEKKRKEKEESRPATVTEEDEELKLDLRTMPVKQHAPPPPAQSTNQAPQRNSSHSIKESDSVAVESHPESTAKDSNDKKDGDRVTPVPDYENINIKNKESVVEEKTEPQGDTKVKEAEVETAREQNEDGEIKAEKTETDKDKAEEVKEAVTTAVESTANVIKAEDSEDDAFEQQVEEILEKEKGTVKEFSEDSASDAGLTEKEEGEEGVEESSSQQKEAVEDSVTEAEPGERVEEVKKPGIPKVDSQGILQPERLQPYPVANFIPPVQVEVKPKEQEGWNYVEDEEMVQLQEEEQSLKLEEEELLAIESELRTKIETERSEIERLHQEIAELHYLRQDSDQEEFSSDSESSYESEDEEDLQEILNQLIADNEVLEDIADNEVLEVIIADNEVLEVGYS
ncbi:hypothetical protein FSP39_008678 [Pinctada imbricata]|uniref:Rho-GAP domain-containing protein n=1 Tax=Pinctada imbricata TaxID=66713 RepID=A0AA89BTA1_PINIB|nr:hypothetical protein FSP39_008678 [Pinctada imbricata]